MTFSVDGSTLFSGCPAGVEAGLSAVSILFSFFSRRLLVTTLTLLNAMAAPAIIGFSRKPLDGVEYRRLQRVHLLCL